MDKKPKPAKRRDVLTKKRPKWLDEPDEDAFSLGFDFLSLLMDGEMARMVVEQFRGGDIPYDKLARDLLRAAKLPLLDRSDDLVMQELVKIANGVKLSPPLYIRGGKGRDPIIVDGYYRICASYWCDPTHDIPTKIL